MQIFETLEPLSRDFNPRERKRRGEERREEKKKKKKKREKRNRRSCTKARAIVLVRVRQTCREKAAWGDGYPRDRRAALFSL